MNSRTTRVSVACDGTEGNGASGEAAFSADGQLMGFGSSASNLVPDDKNNSADLFFVTLPAAP